MEQAILWISLAFVALLLLFLGREDWFHLSRPKRRAMAHVVGHREHFEDGARRFSAVLEFADEDGGLVQVADTVYAPKPHPDIGRTIEITHPQNMPDRARISRPWLRGGIYLALLYLLAVLIGRLSGWLSAGHGSVAGL